MWHPLSPVYEALADAPSAVIIISVAVMLLGGFAMTRLTKLCRLPNVTAYILAGILMGPFCFDLVPSWVTGGMDFLSDIALAFIAFGTGQYFRLSVLKKNGARAAVITLSESLVASFAVFAVAFFALRLELAFSIVLAALAAATAPASTMMTIRQTGAKGDFVNTLLAVVAMDDIVGLLAYSVAVSVAVASGTGEAFSFAGVLQPLLANFAVLLLGGLFGGLMRLLLPSRRSVDNRLIIAVALLFGFCGVCAAVSVSPLLGCMSMGTVYVNLAGDDKLFKQLNYWSPPVLLLFFVRSGIGFRLDALFGAGAVGSVPLLLVGVSYFFVRIAGKYGGAYFGCLVTGKPPRVRNTFGLALIPQAGVAIGLAALGARTLGGEVGEALETVILASSVLYELVGPACAKAALYLSRSYSANLDEIAPATGEEENEVEKLIRQIAQIQQTLPEHHESEEERAFTEGAEEMLAASRRQQRRFFFRR